MERAEILPEQKEGSCNEVCINHSNTAANLNQFPVPSKTGKLHLVEGLCGQVTVPGPTGSLPQQLLPGETGLPHFFTLRLAASLGLQGEGASLSVPEGELLVLTVGGGELGVQPVQVSQGRAARPAP